MAAACDGLDLAVAIVSVGLNLAVPGAFSGTGVIVIANGATAFAMLT